MVSRTFLDLLKYHCIALTGGIATGKSTVAQILRAQGVIVFDADELARIVVEPGGRAYGAVAAHFGRRILTADGPIDRKALRQIILAEPTKRKLLEQMTHPAIAQEFEHQVEALGLTEAPQIFFYEAALIHERRRAKDFKAVWCTECSPQTQLSRLVARSSPQVAPDEAQKLIDSQMPASEKAALSDAVINTEVPLDEIAEQVKKLLIACSL